nr:hypothetical protein [Bacillus infantis]
MKFTEYEHLNTDFADLLEFGFPAFLKTLPDLVKMTEHAIEYHVRFWKIQFFYYDFATINENLAKIR